MLTGLLLIGLSAPALSDQTDPRLDGLFDRLLAAPGPAEAALVEQQIWSIWLETPDDAIASDVEQGMAAMQRGDFPAALDVFDRVIDLAPDYAEGWNKRATLHYLMENFDASLADIARTLELEPRHFGALSGRGLVYIKMKDLERALTSFEAALAVSPQMVGPRVNAEALRRLLKEREI